MSFSFPINLLIADDHQLIIDGLLHILKAVDTIGKIHIAKNGMEAVEKAGKENIDCVIMDIHMPKLNGLEATRLLKKEKPEIKVLIVSMLCEPAIVSKMLKAGADAFITKDTDKSELLKALEKVMNNEKYISPEISADLFRHLNDKDVSTSNNKSHLTKREIEIIRYIADGLTNNEIAEKLFLSSVTVDTHRKNMLAKLGLKNTAMLIKYAAEHQLL